MPLEVACSILLISVSFEDSLFPGYKRTHHPSYNLGQRDFSDSAPVACVSRGEASNKGSPSRSDSTEAEASF